MSLVLHSTEASGWFAIGIAVAFVLFIVRQFIVEGSDSDSVAGRVSTVLLFVVFVVALLGALVVMFTGYPWNW